MSAEFGACLAGAVQRWRFPKPQGGGAVKVAYPFVLETGADDESRSGFQVTPGAFR